MKEFSNSVSGQASFSRIGGDMKQEFSFHHLKSRSHCQLHPQTEACFADHQTRARYCESCSRQLSSRGRHMTPLASSERALDQVFHRAQNSIKAHIELYSSKLNELVEEIHDMQIRDLMYFNQLLENNKKAFQRGEINVIFQLPKECQGHILELEKNVLKAIAKPFRSFETGTTSDSRNKPKTFSENFSAIKGQSFFDSQRDSDDSDKNTLPFGLELSLNKSAQNEQKRKDQKDSLEETPESVKSKLSCMGRIKPEKHPKIGMFDRILVCESVGELELDPPRTSSKVSTKQKSPKLEYRYGRISEQ